ncbi:MAG: heterodisulfide reductase-related iron-sulfur binding cluster, partial [Cyanobacteria bacterium J06628_3]
MLKYAYFPGCVAQGACRELHFSTIALSSALDIELIELKKAACCGSGTFKEDSQLLEDTVNARNIALAEELLFRGWLLDELQRDYRQQTC